MIEIYTDGSSRGNPGRGGYGVVAIKDNKILYSHSEQCDNTTNNREELKAILHALEYTQQYPNEVFKIYSDSAYCVNIFNDWIYTWLRNNWYNSKKKIIENKDLVESLYKYCTIIFPNFQVEKCCGHAGVSGNELADALATANPAKYEKLKNLI